MKSISNKYYTYIFILLPMTIVSIAYLSLIKDILKKNVFWAFNLTYVGERAYSHVESRLGNNIYDISFSSVLVDLDNVI